MARSALRKRLDRLEQAAEGECIVYEAGADIPEEERERFLREVVGEIGPNSLVVCMRLISRPDTPPRLLYTRPMSARAKDLTATTGADPSQSTQLREASVPARLLDEEVIPKYNPVLSFRPRDRDTEAEEF